jgi:hypothetical protein
MVVRKTFDTLLAAVLLEGLPVEVVVAHTVVASGSAVLVGTQELNSNSMNTDMEEMADDTSTLVVQIAIQSKAHKPVVRELADHIVLQTIDLNMGNYHMVVDDTAVPARNTAQVEEGIRRNPNDGLDCTNRSGVLVSIIWRVISFSKITYGFMVCTREEKKLRRQHGVQMFVGGLSA